MNERIRELVRQTVVAVDIVTGNESLDDELAKMYIPDCFSEKFAELIVKECNEVLRLVPYNSNVEFGDEVIYQDAIKEHFGVEE